MNSSNDGTVVELSDDGPVADGISARLGEPIPSATAEDARDGEAANIRAAFSALGDEDRAALPAFLNNL